MINGNAWFAYFNKIWGIPRQMDDTHSGEFTHEQAHPSCAFAGAGQQTAVAASATATGAAALALAAVVAQHSPLIRLYDKRVIARLFGGNASPRATRHLRACSPGALHLKIIKINQDAAVCGARARAPLGDYIPRMREHC